MNDNAIITVLSYDSFTRFTRGDRSKGWTVETLQDDAYNMDQRPRGRRRAA